jgi:hypothetical protein
MNFVDGFDLSIEILKLGLFDKLIAEDLTDTAILDENEEILYSAISSKSITQLDYLAFLIGIRNMLKNQVTYTFTCHKNNCLTEFKHVIKLDETFEDLIYEFQRQREFYERVDEKTGNIWKFELTNFSMLDYLYFRHFMNKLNTADKTSPEVMWENKFVRPILYVRNIWINDEIIEDWPKLAIPEKLSFWNKIPPDLTINTIGTSNDTIYNFIKNTFFEEKLEDKIESLGVQCPKCGHKWSGIFSFDNFFTF